MTGSPMGTAAPRVSPPAVRTFMECLRRLEEAQKPGVGVPAYTRWVNRRLARYAAATAVSLRLSPNMVTAGSAALSLFGLLFVILMPPSLSTGLTSALCLAAGYVLDSADGQVARVTERGSPAGEWLDHVVDAIRTPAIHLAVLAGLALHVGVPPVVMAVPLLYCLLSAGHFMSQILAEQLVRVHGSHARTDSESSPLHSLVRLPMDAGLLCWVFALWGNTPAFLAAYGGLFLLNLIAGAMSMRRKYRTLVSL